MEQKSSLDVVPQAPPSLLLLLFFNLNFLLDVFMCVWVYACVHKHVTVCVQFRGQPVVVYSLLFFFPTVWVLDIKHRL